MSGTGSDNLTRLHELLADQATQGLSEPEQAELATLLAAHPGEESYGYELVAAALDLPALLSEADRAEPMPAQLRTRVEDDAIGWLARSRGLALTAAPSAPPPREMTTAPTHTTSPAVTPSATPVTPLFPWLAAAACLLLAIAGWWARGTDAPVAPSAPPLAQLYEQMKLGETAHLAAWNDLAASDVSGDIVWDNEAQAGVMRFRGLAVNDPRELQYQLWIFDEGRKQFTEFDAVDGGVFNIERSGDDVFVHVQAKLRVSQPYLFAVTTEPSGGVVKHVDTPDHQIVLTASPDV